MSNQGASALQDYAWLPARWVGSGGYKLPAYGVAAFNQILTYNALRIIDLKTPAGDQNDRLLFVNGPEKVSSVCSVLLPHDRPVKCAIESQGVSTIRPGTIWGPVGTAGGFGATDDRTYKLYPGLPGFRCVDTGSASGRTTAWFVRNDFVSPLWGKVTSDWWTTRTSAIPTVTARPCVDRDAVNGVYDGSVSYRPAISYTIHLPRAGNGAITAANNFQDPNVRTDDIIQYTQVFDGFNELSKFYAVGPYLDAKVGMAMPWPLVNTGTSTLPATRPRGWGLMDGTENASGLGGSGRDLRGRFLVGYEDRTGGSVPAHSDDAYDMGATGGTKTHTHSTTAVQSGSGTNVAHDSADHRPPWMTMAWIERIW